MTDEEQLAMEEAKLKQLSDEEQLAAAEAELADLEDAEGIAGDQKNTSEEPSLKDKIIDYVTPDISFEGMKNRYIEGLQNAKATYVAAIPGLSQLEGAGGAMLDLAMGKVSSISELSDSYTQNRDAAKQAIKELESKYPAEFAQVDAVKNVGAMAILPSATMSARAASAAALGISEAMLNDQETKQAFEQGLITGGISLGAEVVTKGASRALRGIAETSAMKSVGALAKNSVKKIKELAMRGVTNSQQFFDDVINGKNLEGKPLLSVTKPMEEIAQDASEMATFHGQQMGVILTQIDKMNQALPSVDGNLIAARAAAKLQASRDLSQLNPDDIAEISKLQTFIDTAFTNKQFTLSDLHSLKTSLKGSYDLKKQSFELKKSDRVYKEVVDDLTDIIDTRVGMMSEKELAIPYFDAKRKFATMSVVADTARDTALKGSGGVLGDIRENLVRNIAIAGLSGAASSQNGNSFATGAAIGALLFNASRNPGVNTAIAKSLGRVGNALSKNPQRYNTYAQRIAVAASLGDQQLVQEVAATEAEIDLDAKPVKRTSQDLIANKDKLFALLESKGVATAPLREAIDKSDGQAIADFMSGVSKQSFMKSYIEPGIGWDGKVSDPQDIAIIQAGIQSNKDLTPRQRRQMEDELLSSGRIPLTPNKQDTETNKVARRMRKIGQGSQGDF